MPYVKQDERGQYVKVERIPETTGQLNYLITSLCNAYLRQRNSDPEYGFIGPSYGAINDIIGVLECAKLEYYRRLAAPYEDEKVRENGDLPWPSTSSL